MASTAPQKCCTVGVTHEGTAKGDIKTLGGVETYFSYPANKSTENAILILPDVIGHRFINVQLIADQFAANGYFTVVPDLFHGDSIPLNPPDGFDFMKWLSGPPGHMPNRVQPVCEAVIKELRSSYGVKKLGGVGYCFGAKYVTLNLTPGSGLDVGYMAHPSLIEEDELRKIKGPLSIAAAETDHVFPIEKRHTSEAILAELKPLPYQITLYSGCAHGFAVRGDVSDKLVRFGKEEAFLQAVHWFDTFLKA